jgi:outer membrane receptor protein involved in Fe transport
MASCTHLRLTVLAFAATGWHGAVAADPAPAIVEVVGTTPLPGLDVARSRIPANVQALDGDAVNAPDAASLPDALNRRLGSVFVNEIQGNPFQPDVNYRGFTASPLLGTPQGLSVYVDGVRMNQPFGDVVSWDLIPRAAVASLTLMPGSNPLFGLNTLGGALAVRTKDGLHDPGTAVQAQGGSHGHGEAGFEHGGHDDAGLHWYVAGTGFRDGGWRAASPTRLGQLFGKLGWHGADTEVALSAALASSRLAGNGLQEQRLLARDYASVYTKPDETRNRAVLLNLTASHRVADGGLWSGNAYVRRIRTATVNGDLNEDALTRSVVQPDADDPAEQYNGLVNRTDSRQVAYGLAAQVAFSGRLAGHANAFTAGAGFDASRVDFRQGTQFGYLNPDRSIAPVDFYADGTEVDDDGVPVDARVDLTGRTRTWSVYATDTLDVRSDLHVTLSGRYNRAMVHNRDRIAPGGGSGSLDGDHRFGRFNPAVGVTWTPLRGLNAYAGYNEGSRTPTAVELGCADPANPCKLPNAMAGDPPLRRVVTRTWEAGLLGTVGRMHWHAGLFRATNDDDILFVADNAAGFGYFRNFGRTRRQGVELGAEGHAGPFALSAHYTWLDATFQSGETINSPGNSSADANGNIAIRPGDRLPLVPHHVFKARAEWQVTPAWSVELGLLGVSGSTARGNENGRHRPDGMHFLGSGATSGHVVFDLGTTWQATARLRFFAQMDNLFDRRYATAAQLGATGFTADGAFLARPFAAQGDNAGLVHSTFYAPGAPRTFRAGLRYTFE